MKKNLLFALIVTGLFFIGIEFIPKYPKINSNQSYEKVKYQIDDIVIANLKKASFEFMDDRRKTIDLKKEAREFPIRLENCKTDTKCLVEEYEDFMDDNLAPSLRKVYRYHYMEAEYGRIGVLINDKIKEFY